MSGSLVFGLRAHMRRLPRLQGSWVEEQVDQGLTLPKDVPGQGDHFLGGGHLRGEPHLVDQQQPGGALYQSRPGQHGAVQGGRDGGKEGAVCLLGVPNGRGHLQHAARRPMIEVPVRRKVVGMRAHTREIGS